MADSCGGMADSCGGTEENSKPGHWLVLESSTSSLQRWKVPLTRLSKRNCGDRKRRWSCYLEAWKG